jgi:membrane protein DedA with SNARE-associated domain
MFMPSRVRAASGPHMLAEITALLVVYRYWVIFPFALFEAPLMSIVIGFFVAIGQLSLLPAFSIVVAGDVIGDTALYFFGRWGRPAFAKAGSRLGLSPSRAGYMADQYVRHSQRAIVVSKLVHGIGFTGLIVAGSLRVPYPRFFLTCIVVTIAQSAVLIVIGMLSGNAYQSLASYLDYFNAVLAGALIVGSFIFYRSLARKIK